MAFCVLKSEPPNANLWLRACTQDGPHQGRTEGPGVERDGQAGSAEEGAHPEEHGGR